MVVSGLVWPYKSWMSATSVPVRRMAAARCHADVPAGAGTSRSRGPVLCWFC